VTIETPEHLRAITPYVPGKPLEEAERELAITFVKLASNENPLGPSPKAVAALHDACAGVNRYPDGSGHYLRHALAARHGMRPEQIVLGNGSTELVEILAKAYLATGKGAVVSEQAFIMYSIAVRAMAAPLRSVPQKDDHHDLPAMAEACDAGTALVFIANPNNPTGTYVGRAAFDAYFERVPKHVLTIIDQAYFEYVEVPDYPDCLDYLRAGRSVVVLRTFSKIHGLAGLRIGYGVTSPEVTRALEAVRSPFNTSAVAQKAALAALEDTAHVERSRRENARGVKYLQGEMARRGISFLPTVANFILIRTALPAADLYRTLLARGVIVRPMGAYGYPDGVRVSIGTEAENRRFLDALDQSLTPAGGAASSRLTT
jgi:histidinol-phosphate aminotransferase